MSLPSGVDPGYVLCVLWIALAVGFLTAVHELADVGSLREAARSRTYRRLLKLNEYLDGQVDTAWKKTPSDDIVPDLPALRQLKNRVDLAVRLDLLIDRRVQAGEICRVIAVGQIGLAVLAAALLFFKALPRDFLWRLGYISFGLTTAVILVLLMSMALIGLRVSKGQDL